MEGVIRKPDSGTVMDSHLVRPTYDRHKAGPHHVILRLYMPTQKTILIIEDEKSLRGALVDFLHLKNFIPLEAKNGREGLEMALLKHPDLILLDLIMPEMDGMATLKKIREDAWGEKVPIIILTNLSATKEQLADDEVTRKPTYYLIKSDWKLQDIVKKIEKIVVK
jgi:CheY-like chemotaxis protein